MGNRRFAWGFTIIAILCIVTIICLSWANYQFVIQSQEANQFLPRWLGTRLYLTQGWSPYSQETNAEIQKTIYGRQVRADEDPALYLYPFYSFLIFSPFALTDKYLIARVIWMVILELALIAITVLSISLARWRTSAFIWLLLILFSLAWYYSVRPVMDGDISILCAFFLVLALALIRAEQDALAGLLLSIATIKPNMILVVVLFILIWAISMHRWLLFWSFLGCLGLIVAGTSLLMPSWLVENLRQLVQYLRSPQINNPATLVGYWLPGIGKQFGWALTIGFSGLLIVEWVRGAGKDFRWFLWTVFLTLAISPLLGIPTSINNYVVMLPGFILVLAVWGERWGKLGLILIACSMVLMSFGVWGIVWYGQQQGIPAELNPYIFFMLPIFMIVVLYWVRWWAVHPPRLPLQEMAGVLK